MEAQNQFGLSEKSIETVLNVLTQFDTVLSARIFGSRAKENFKEGGDIDLCLVVDSNFLREQKLAMMRQFDESSLPCSVDLLIYSEITNEKLKEHIDSMGRMIYPKGVILMEEQVRDKQRFENYKKSLNNLRNALDLKKERPLTELETQGLLKTFEFTYELAWKTMKDFLEYNGIVGIVGGRNAFRGALQNGLISQGEIWQEMVDDRNLLTHDYDEKIAGRVAERVVAYAELLSNFKVKMQTLIDG